MAKTITQKSSSMSRPPIVVVLGHVDHGKTTLLDKIRHTHLVDAEAGGITQHIGAYQVKGITFIDTPGHAVFAKMRSQGAQVADLAVLVIAADEGVKPQTLESLKFIQEAGINYLVALNKIDLPNINLERVKKLLVESGIMIEGYGGNIVVVPVSAKTGQGLDDLLEMILLLAAMADLKGSPVNKLEAVVIESKMNHRRGPMVTILIRDGSLKIGDEIQAGDSLAKIKAIFDDKNQPVKIAGPSQPVEVLGFKTVPTVGSLVEQIKAGPVSRFPHSDVLPAKNFIFGRGAGARVGSPASATRLKIILKTDTAGSLGALAVSLPKDLVVIKADVGDVNESDILLARATGAEIIAFNVKIPTKVKKLAEMEKINVADYKIIYELLEAVEKKLLQKTEPTSNEIILGKAEIIAEFKMKEKVAGGRVLEGEIKKVDRFHLLRKGQISGEGRIKSLKVGKNDVEKVKAGEEFGAILNLDFIVGDMLVSFRKAGP